MTEGLIMKQVQGQVWGKVREKVCDPISKIVLDQVDYHARMIVLDQVDIQVDDQVAKQVWVQVWEGCRMSEELTVKQVQDRVFDQVFDQIRRKNEQKKLKNSLLGIGYFGLDRRYNSTGNPLVGGNSFYPIGVCMLAGA